MRRRIDSKARIRPSENCHWIYPPVTQLTISVIITTYNEGRELYRTVRSVLENTPSLTEIIVVDDGSTDGSCEALAADQVRIIRHDSRLGVARSRDEGSRVARGDVICYLDAHQRVERRCLDRCARVAVDQQAIACPDLRAFGLLKRRTRGADFQMCPEQGYFSARWRSRLQSPGVSPVTALRAPPYLIPRPMYAAVSWSRSLQGWGATEASMVVKSFFSGIGILHIAGPLARHRFQKEFSYPTSWDGIWRNHAIIARVCFDNATWLPYWLPRVFDPRLTEEARQALASVEIQAEHEAFQRNKVRADRQFWTDLLQTAPPADV